MDSFGRTRRCLKKDLPVYQKQDVELNKAQISTPAPTSYGNFVAAGEDIVQSGEPQSIRSVDEEARRLQRQLWEEEEEKNRQKPKVHYQDILYQGKVVFVYFSFTTIAKVLFKNPILFCIALGLSRQLYEFFS